MKRFISMLLVVVMMAAMLVGCAPAVKEEESASVGAESNEGESAFKAIAKEDILVGVIHITDPAEGSGYTYTHDMGIVGMQKAFGLKDEQIIRKNNVNDSDATAIENAMLECIEAGCKIIFATSWGYMDTCAALAEEYPDVIFCHGTGYKSNGKNFINYFGRIYQARYLSGIAAGLKTETNKIGYVAAWGTDNAEVTSGCNAFAMGVNSVNPEAQVYVKATNSWYDPEGEGAAAQALLDMGCDVIGQHCDTNNPMLNAEKAGKFGVGYNSDMSKDAPKAVLTSTIWNWEIFYTWAVQSVIEGTWTGENYYGGLKEGFVGIADLADFCADGTAEAIKAAQDKIISGEWDVFDGEIETNTGDKATSENYTDINWYFKTVVEA